MPTTRSATGLLAGALLALLALPAVAQNLQIIASPVREVRLSDPIEALGTLRANESAELTAITTDTIAEIRFDDGARVSAGDVLVVLSNREQVADRAEAVAEVEELRRQYERTQDLARRGTASEAMLDQRRRELDTARARLNAAEARLANRRLVAPFDGVTGLRNVSVGSLLSPGTVVTTIHDDSLMKLDFSVPERYLADVVVGLQVEAQSRAYPDTVFAGEVASVDNAVDPVTRAFRVRAMIPNPERNLRPGMLLTLTLSSAERDTLVIPEEALTTRGRTHSVFVVEGEGEEASVHRREVWIGVRRTGEVEILDGLQAGELVVTHGGFRVSDGDQVRIKAVVEDGDELADVLAQGRREQDR